MNEFDPGSLYRRNNRQRAFHAIDAFGYIVRLDRNLASFVENHSIEQILSGEAVDSLAKACELPELLNVVGENAWVALTLRDSQGTPKMLARAVSNIYWRSDSADPDGIKFKGFDQFISDWFFSGPFLEAGFGEPMEELLFKNATEKIPLRLTRDGHISYWDHKKSMFVDSDLLSDVFNTRAQQIDKEIARLHTYIRSVYPTAPCEEVYAEISSAIKGLYDKLFEDETKENKRSIITSITDILNKTGRPHMPDENNILDLAIMCIKIIICYRLFDSFKIDSFKEKNPIKWSSIIYIPDTLSFGKESNGIVFASTNYDNDNDNALVPLLSVVANRIFAVLYHAAQVRQVEISATRSAIGSIMSRNGSHNIGSHVLSALSHNVGTMPDDQMLYQYIQHRMDYIATATTERPTWTQPIMFVSNMMKRFLSQRHLLNYICRSEGLRAYEFQSTRAKFESGGGRIKFHIRKMNFAGEKVLCDFIDYIRRPDTRDKSGSNGGTCGIDPQDDVTLALPGGMVGQHAFFTIIENIVRNAAKHDWSTANAAKQNPRSGGDLDVYIDFEDDPENVHFLIWTRLSDVFGGKKLEDKVAKTSAEPLKSEKAKALSESENLSDLPLHHRQQVKLAIPFITDRGELRRENWGLAEMKISAGYLQKAKTEDIGGIGSIEAGGRIIVPLGVPDSYAADANIRKNLYHLGYKFDIPKAKLILFLVDQKPSELSELESALKARGIFVKAKSEIDEAAELNYGYVVMDTFSDVHRNWRLPFRLLAVKHGAKNVAGDMIAAFDQAHSVSEYLCGMIDKHRGDGVKLGDALTEDVCACWVRHLLALRKDLGGKVALEVSVDIDHQDTSSGKCLASEEDVVEFAFNEGLIPALDSYLAACTETDEVNRKIVDELTRRNQDEGLIYRRSGDEGNAKTIEDFVKMQLAQWLESMPDPDSDIRTAMSYLLGRTKETEELEKQKCTAYKEAERFPKNSPEYIAQRRIGQACLKKLNEARRKIDSPVKHLVAYLVSYCGQIKNLLSKYAEKIATLPETFSCGRTKGGFDGEWSAAGIVPWQEGIKRLRYKRHQTDRTDDDVYLEALSGTQSYLNSLVNIEDRDFALKARLVENALLRILIIDERTREFLEKHEAMKKQYENLGIFVANDRKLNDELSRLRAGMKVDDPREEMADGFVNLSANDVYSFDDQKTTGSDAIKKARITKAKRRFRPKYDAVIIHQGIIDKWIPGSSDAPAKVAGFIDTLKRIFRYVVITTGRGTPANIPDMGRVLPFSTIQTTLFRQYPEKMIFTDAIMNILPVVRKKGFGE